MFALLASFALAVQFLTRIPLNINITVSEQRLGQSVLFYPLVGLLIGSFLLILIHLLPEQSFAINAAIILTAWVLVTGGLHLDGLADCSDAWAGGLGDKERSLKIMKDPAAGPIAVIILVLILLLKWNAIQSLLLADTGLNFLLLAPFLGRVSILILMLSTPYVRENGLGSAMQKHLPQLAAKLIVLISLLLCVWFTNFYTLLSMLLLVGGIRYLSIQRIQGVTGDVYGASVEIVETAILISLAMTYG
ncbi:MAG: adenosylcobinamide-GDP ribazoletransferase [Gammaproteobacteria bacterium]|jgi:adenosylcobinamide-GDP ribazoletransferase|nr:adenosylcobinamide-GDP ribazoletransferase [Gammaproteobacteria bacterium]MBT4147133.1 adenosylcobinamide-GDP ribazoletransferase [Gammaproteobacteria bacterium]MBT5223550.1 adenosylcobinamide-GDP ribazoletransferase [Gammaproteobacteria bacterium]MBT5825854.1 adenosylcobinamide-GDP ribazoletransferase [Gammaproteobacteria bacterium]MBT5966598.1 adenosylcobinamide-GDP ribazoletransferase [Gammaproteobacteria bacterium]